MTNEEFRERCARLGLHTGPDVALVLGISRSLAWRLLKGERDVSPRVEYALTLVETTLPAGLNIDERRVLALVPRVGDRIRTPKDRSTFEAGKDWEAVYSDMHDRGLITFDKRGKPITTQLGMDAIEWYRMHGLLNGEKQEATA